MSQICKTISLYKLNSRLHLSFFTTRKIPKNSQKPYIEGIILRSNHQHTSSYYLNLMNLKVDEVLEGNLQGYEWACRHLKDTLLSKTIVQKCPVKSYRAACRNVLYRPTTRRGTLWPNINSKLHVTGQVRKTTSCSPLFFVQISYCWRHFFTTVTKDRHERDSNKHGFQCLFSSLDWTLALFVENKLSGSALLPKPMGNRMWQIHHLCMTITRTSNYEIANEYYSILIH